MTDERLDRIQQELYRETIEVPEEAEMELIDVAHETANKLYFHPSKEADFEYLGNQYKCKYLSFITNFKKIMYVVMDDITTQTRIRGQVEVDNGLTELENIRATIAAMLRHHTGQTEVGEID